MRHIKTKNAKNKNKLIKNSISIISVFILLVLGYIFFGRIYFQSKLAKHDVTTQSMGAEEQDSNNVKGWTSRIHSYASRIGRKTEMGEEQKWLFSDEMGEYKNLYCVQSGKSHAETYTPLDIYNLTNEEINTYFNGEEQYNHFLWIIENMYLSNMDDPEIKEQFFNKLETTNSGAKNAYDKMEDELNNLFTRAGLKRQENTSNFIFELYKGVNEKTGTTVSIDSRENLIKIIQNYVLLQNFVQKGGKTRDSILDENGNLNIKLRTYSDDVSTKKDEFDESNSEYSTEFAREFARDLANYLINDYKEKNYNSNKYRNFDSNDYDGKVNINKERSDIWRF